MELAKELSFADKVKKEAQAEVQSEKIKKATKELTYLYRKLADAEQIVKNVKNEIADYEMQLKDA